MPCFRVRAALAAAENRKIIRQFDWFYLDGSYYYHQGHTWVKPEAGDIVKIGIDDFARKLVGVDAQWKLPEKGQYLHQGAKAWSAEIGGEALSFLAPISGEVMQVNELVNKNGEFHHADPYGNGWFMLIRVPRLSAHLKNLLTGKMAYDWMQQTVDKLNRSITTDMVPVLADGGQIKECFLREIVPQNWHSMAEDFLLSKDITHNE